MKNIKKQAGASLVSALVGLTLLMIAVGAWITHIVTCLQDEHWGFLIAGAIMFPIAIIHGLGVWLGIF